MSKKPPTALVRFRSDSTESNPSQVSQTWHTRPDCPHVERIDELEVVPAGEDIPAVYQNYAGGVRGRVRIGPKWCQWCQKRTWIGEDDDV